MGSAASAIETRLDEVQRAQMIPLWGRVAAPTTDKVWDANARTVTELTRAGRWLDLALLDALGHPTRRPTTGPGFEALVSAWDLIPRNAAGSLVKTHLRPVARHLGGLTERQLLQCLMTPAGPE